VTRTHMHDVERVFLYCQSPAETRDMLAPDTERPPAVPRGNIQSAEEDIHRGPAPAQTRGTLALDTGRRPAVTRQHMHSVKVDLRHGRSPSETRDTPGLSTARVIVAGHSVPEGVLQRMGATSDYDARVIVTGHFDKCQIYFEHAICVTRV
jgi:hypothetical protein